MSDGVLASQTKEKNLVIPPYVLETLHATATRSWWYGGVKRQRGILKILALSKKNVAKIAKGRVYSEVG